jgi:MHS family proline/betaine transporter-like MFS transporter
MIGNALEWYDFAVYGYFAVPIGRHFFPHEDPIAQVLAAFGVFALGYLVRPLGGVVVGHIGDRLGRRPALIFSVGAMAIPTFLIGVLPGYATLGVLAPIALTLLRVVQGISVGGEYPCSMVFLVERAGDGRRGLIGAFAATGAVAGILSGSAAGATLAAIMSPEALDAWGWRIPFLFGLVAGAAGLVLRRHVLEAEPAAATGSVPIVETLRDHGWIVLQLAALTAFTAIPFHIMFIYIVSWLQLTNGIAPAQALEINTVNMILLLPVMLVAGWASDRYGRRSITMASTALGLLAALPLFWVMHHPSLILLGQFGLMLIVGPYVGVHPSLLVETAPSRVRCTAVGLGYNISRADRRGRAAGRDLAGGAHRRPAQPRLRDHGGGRGEFRRAAVDQGDLSQADEIDPGCAFNIAGCPTEWAWHSGPCSAKVTTAGNRFLQLV